MLQNMQPWPPAQVKHLTSLQSPILPQERTQSDDRDSPSADHTSLPASCLIFEESQSPRSPRITALCLQELHQLHMQHADMAATGVLRGQLAQATKT